MKEKKQKKKCRLAATLRENLMRRKNANRSEI
jgi:hypothetical protein